MASPLNTFTVVLLAFPFYLAQKGRLAEYIALAKPGAKTVQSATPSKASSTDKKPATKTAATTDNAPSMDNITTAFNVFAEASAIFA